MHRSFTLLIMALIVTLAVMQGLFGGVSHPTVWQLLGW